MKRADVVQAMSRFPSLEFVFTSPVEPADPVIGYRTRAKLMVAPSGGIGLHTHAGTPQILDIPECRVLSPAVAAVVNALRAMIQAPPEGTQDLLTPLDPRGKGSLRAIEVREVVSGTVATETDDDASPAILLTLVLQASEAADEENLQRAGKTLQPLLPKVIGLAVHLADSPSSSVLASASTIHLAGIAIAEDRIGKATHLATFGAFVRVHREQSARLQELVIREVAALVLDSIANDSAPNAEGEEEPPPPSALLAASPTRVLDLYGGSGPLALALARAHCDVAMVESSAAARHARQAAEAQGLSLTVHEGHVDDVLGRLLSETPGFDAVVLNPPRRGVSAAARDAVARLAPELLVYVSTDPETLARDLDHFARLGYTTTEIFPMDMAPLTGEVDTVSVLRRGPLCPPRVIYEDAELLVVEKDAHEAVQPNPEYAVALRERCERLPSCGDLLPLTLLEPGTSGLCFFAKHVEAERKWSAALEKNGRRIYLVGVKGTTPTKGSITRDLREQGRALPARTRYRRLATTGGHSVVRVIPDGGRAHQIRRHFAAIGHPVLGDERYGHEPTNRYFEERHGLDRNFMHLVRVEVDHPETGERLTIEAPLRGDLRATLQRVGGQAVLDQLEHKAALGTLPPPPASSPPEPPVSPARSDEAPASSTVYPPSSGRGGAAPDLDEAPRTLRQRITTDDDGV